MHKSSYILKYIISIITLLCLTELSIAQNITGTCIRVIDGDTIDIITKEEKEALRIRLWGIDAPESSQEYGREATSYLANKILGKTVHVYVSSTDIYGRCIGKIHSDDGYINLLMVSSGHAWYYEKYAPEDKDLEKAQQDAQNKKKGVWSNPLAIAPWFFRREKINTNKYIIYGSCRSNYRGNNYKGF